MVRKDSLQKTLAIGVLWTGEPQIEMLLPSISKLKGQFHVIVKVVAFEKNYPAHMKIWKFFEEYSYADYRIKLDGDMTLTDPELFINSLDELSDNDFFIFRVRDHITGRLLNGVNIFSKGYEIDVSNCNDLFPDKLGGEWRQKEYNGVSHCKEPSPEQVGEFVGHRLRKIFGANDWRKSRSYLRLVLFAIKNNIQSIFSWGRIAIVTWLSNNYKNSIRNYLTESVNNKKMASPSEYEDTSLRGPVSDYHRQLLKILKSNGFIV